MEIKVQRHDGKVLTLTVDQENDIGKILVKTFPGIVGLMYQRKAPNEWKIFVIINDQLDLEKEHLNSDIIYHPFFPYGVTPMCSLSEDHDHASSDKEWSIVESIKQWWYGNDTKYLKLE